MKKMAAPNAKVANTAQTLRMLVVTAKAVVLTPGLCWTFTLSSDDGNWLLQKSALFSSQYTLQLLAIWNDFLIFPWAWLVVPTNSAVVGYRRFGGSVGELHVRMLEPDVMAN